MSTTMKVSRRGLLASTAAASASAIAAICIPSRAKAPKSEFIYKLANNLPDEHPINVRLREMSVAIMEQTDGRVDIRIFSSSQLGSDTYLLNQIRGGGLEFLALSGMILATLVPVAAIASIGFAFPDYRTVWSAMDGDLGAFIRSRIANADLLVLDKIWDNGFRQTTSSTRPIETPDDYRGFKIRVPMSPLSISMFQALGASPSPVNFNEVYMALQTKMVDGQENPLALISMANIYEVQKYCSLTNHMWDGYWILASRRAWEKLPQTLQTIVAKNFDAASLKARLDTESLNADLSAALTKKGLVFNQPAIALLREKLYRSGFYAYWESEYGDAWTILEKHTGKLT